MLEYNIPHAFILVGDVTLSLDLKIVLEQLEKCYLGDQEMMVLTI